MKDDTWIKKTVEEVKSYLRQNSPKGCKCPACGQHVKIYKRSISGLMAYCLILMHRCSQPGEYVNVNQLHAFMGGKSMGRVQGGDFAKLHYWGLIEPEMSVREDGSKRTGRWTITNNGQFFARCRLFLPKYAIVYNGKCVGHEGDKISIQECLGKKFDYQELMTLTPEI